MTLMGKKKKEIWYVYQQNTKVLKNNLYQKKMLLLLCANIGNAIKALNL